ncbi:hypothetical protein GV789_29140, partial [Nocardia cyriacigeorgica]|nr:hypothetical protein [Nocardia cyriacigeorgica]
MARIRIGERHTHSDMRIIGLAARTLVVVANASRLATQPPPPPPSHQLLDLESLLD